MQSLNDDMDRLFRRAAEGYPLDTGSADWDKVQAMLAQDAATFKPAAKDRRKLLWLLLLLPIGFLCNQYVFNGIDYLQKPNASTVNKSSDIQHNETNAVPSLATGASKQGEKQLNDRANLAAAKGSSTTETTSLKRSTGPTGLPSLNTASPVLKNTSTSVYQVQDIELQKVYSQPSSRELLLSENSHEMTAALSPFLLPTPFIYDTWALKPAFQHENTPTKSPIKTSSKQFYAGILGGLDATTIKMQKVDALGYSAGILLGYSFGHKWSVESGLFMDKKFYYTKGEYFSRSHIYMPAYYTITTVTGDCRMWEVPITTKYTIRQTATTSFFSTVGASSYFMKKESYDYDYKNANTGQEGSYYKSYTNSSKRFFSVIHLSVGYTHQLGRIGDLRIEPYVKIPVQKVGIGQMPITSGGIQVGITRRLF